MAQGRRKAPPAAAAETPVRRVTQRVVLEKVRVVVLPEDPSDPSYKTLQDALEALGDHANADQPTEAWVERGVFEGERQVDAIRQFAKPDTPEQRAGSYRAVPVSNWKGGQRYTAPVVSALVEEALD